MANKPGIIHRLLTGFWSLVDQGRRSVVNILFLLIIYVIVKNAFFTEHPSVKPGSALVISPVGYIVDQLDYIDPLDEAIDEMSERNNKIPQTLLKDLLTAINEARQDSKISALVLKLGGLHGAAPSKLQDIAEAIQRFKTSGKPVYAYSEFYNQSQYFIAAQADSVFMDPMGGVFIEGYGRFNTYFKGALDNLGISYHVFKVGTYKAAVEPFVRNDMSEQAKEANLHYLGDLWQSYTADVAKARELPVAHIAEFSNNYLETVSQSDKETSDIALDASLVDALMTSEEMTQYLIEKIGPAKGGDDFLQLSSKEYLNILKAPSLIKHSASDKVAVVVAKGNIYNGTRKAGAIGGDSTAELIRRARRDDTVKALVLRVDSPGGSAYASEMIRREVVKTREAGKPVIVSMGSYAASGGYWISASADEIWASATTITGSIGIYGMIPTFEKPLNKMGIHRDGVGTTNLSGAFDLGKPLRDDVGNAIQSTIEKGYRRFLTIVSEGRDMSRDDVDKIAQGRVWSGKKAHELGLVDNLGGIEQAIESAANKAGLVSYETRYIEQELSEAEQFINNLFNSSLVSGIVKHGQSSLVNQNMMLSPAVILMQKLNDTYQQLAQMNDPQNLYAHCLCSID